MEEKCDTTSGIQTDEWWDKKSDKKWTVMKHKGVSFPEPYKPLPNNIKLLYDGKPITIDKTSTANKFNVTAEEAACFFASKLEQDDRLYQKDQTRSRVIDDKVFINNFWKDWKIILGSSNPIKDFNKVDFGPIQNYIVAQSEAKKNLRKQMTKEEKKEEKEQKTEFKKEFGTADVDGLKIPLGNYVIQPPGLYIGHHKHPLRGKIKKRLEPKDITINVTKKYAPPCIVNGKKCTASWKIIEDRDATWIAAWDHPITGDKTYVYLDRGKSHWVCISDKEKFEKARALNKNIHTIRERYMENLDSKSKDTRQLATAVYLLDKLAIRPGTEKDETKESATKGLTTLECSNLNFLGDNKITFNFLGKSSITFDRTFKVDSKVYRNLQETCRTKSGQLFPNINSTTLNTYLGTLMPNLTSKVFRTWKASSTLEQILNQNIPDIYEETYVKKLAYDTANIEVAKALNHKKLGGNVDQIKKIKDKIKTLKDELKGDVTASRKKTIQKSIELQNNRLQQAEDNISLTTSKVNYLDPRIAVAWCKKAQVPIEKIYNATQLNKFTWAMSTVSKWKF